VTSTRPGHVTHSHFGTRAPLTRQSDRRDRLQATRWASWALPRTPGQRPTGRDARPADPAEPAASLPSRGSDSRPRIGTTCSGTTA